MKSKLVVFILLTATLSLSAQWKPAGDRLKTRWASQIDVNNVLPEYPRPIMERSQWQNLNGLWNYAILPVGKQNPTSFDGKILVPFAIESSLSGVQKRLGSENELWYQREFTRFEKRNEQTGGKGMGRNRPRIPAAGKTGKQSARHLVYPGERHLANRMAGTRS